jgi:hypothetical protein
MKKTFLFVCLTSLFVSSANAGIINNFTEGYDVSNWEQSLDGGAVDLSGAPLSIIEISNNSGNWLSADTDFTIAALSDGLVGFDWSYHTVDEGPKYDSFGWLLNGDFTVLTDDGGSDTQLGTASFFVTSGDVFGFRAHSKDSMFGAATTTISNFSVASTSTSNSANAVPEPSAMLLFSTGIAGLVGIRRKKKIK